MRHLHRLRAREQASPRVKATYEFSMSIAGVLRVCNVVIEEE